MFVMALSLSLVGVLVSGILFAAATRDRAEAAAPAFSPLVNPMEERFFMMRAPASERRGPGGVEALVLQIERHVRLERAAAEAFLQLPTVESLRMRTLAPLAR